MCIHKHLLAALAQIIVHSVHRVTCVDLTLPISSAHAPIKGRVLLVRIIRILH